MECIGSSELVTLVINEFQKHADKIEDIANSMKAEFMKKYSLGKAEFRKYFPFEDLFKVLYYFDFDIKGKTVLDLGCGSVKSPDSCEESDREYEPWLARALSLVMVKVIGIDIVNPHLMNDEPFKYHKVNLKKKDSLSFLKGEDIDMVIAFGLFDSPSLEPLEGRKMLRSINMQCKKFIEPSYFIYQV